MDEINFIKRVLICLRTHELLTKFIQSTQSRGTNHHILNGASWPTDRSEVSIQTCTKPHFITLQDSEALCLRCKVRISTMSHVLIKCIIIPSAGVIRDAFNGRAANDQSNVCRPRPAIKDVALK